MTDNVNSVGVMDDDELADPGENPNAPDPAMLGEGAPKSGALSAALRPAVGSKSDQQDRLSQSRQEMEDLRSQYASTQKQQSDAYAAQKKILDDATQRLMSMQTGPTPQEAMFRMAAAYGAPNRNGVDFQGVNNTQAEILKERREAEVAKQQQLIQNYLGSTQATVGATNSRLGQLTQQMRIAQSDQNNASNAANKPQQMIDKYLTADPNDPSKMIDHPELRAADVQQKLDEARNAAMAKIAAQASANGVVTPEAVAYTQQFGRAPAGFSRNPVINSQLWQAVHAKNVAEGTTTNDWIAQTQMNQSAQGVYNEFVKSGKTAQSLDSINTGIKHTQILMSKIDDLNNTSLPVVNSAVNFLKTQLGDSAPKSFDNARNFVAGEISKAVLPGGGGEMERDKIAAAAKSADSPETLKKIVNDWYTLMAGKTDALRLRWNNGTMGKYGDFNHLLLPETQAALGVQAPAQKPAAAPHPVMDDPVLQKYLNGIK